MGTCSGECSRIWHYGTCREVFVCEELTGMIDVNCKAFEFTTMTKITLPYMKEQEQYH